MTTLIQKVSNWGKSALLGLAAEKDGVLPESGVRVIHFVCHDDGTVIDTQTGLTWMRCAFGKTWDGRSCTGVAKPLTWDQAKALALNHDFAGHNDWRVPNIDELQSLITAARSYRNTYNSIFPNAPNAAHWSSSPSAEDLGLIQFVQLPSGRIDVCAKDYGFGKRVRLVRGGKPLASSKLPTCSDTNSEMDKSIELARMVANDPSGILFGSIANNKNNSINDASMRKMPNFVYEQGCDLMESGTAEHRDVDTATQFSLQKNEANRVDESLPFEKILERLDLLESRFDTAINRIGGVLAHLSEGQSRTFGVIDQLNLCRSVSTEKPSDELLQLRQLVDRMESRFEAFSERVEKAIKLSDLAKQEHVQSPALSIEQFEKAIKSLFSGQLAATQHIVKKVDLRSDESIGLTNTLLIELQRLSSHGLLSHHAKDEPVNGTVPNAITTGVVSTTTLLTQLAELETIPLAELRALLLPLDLLPGAVINDINERALDLIGEPALLEEGDAVVVQREVLLQLIAD
jgi:hypothetical protein